MIDPIGVIGRRPKVIVVGVDGSPSSWDAFDWAAGEAGRLGSELVAVYVQPPVEPLVASALPFGYAVAKEAADSVAEQLHDEVDRRACDVGVKVSFARQTGDTAIALAHVSQSCQADLIVVGKSAKKMHHLVGSIGRRLVSRHDAPAVVVVP